MESLLHLDRQTMFLVDALLLVVFAVAFAFAGLGNKDRRYWVALVASNLTFAVAFTLFSRHIDGSPEVLLLPDCLLVIGLGLRWRAIRSFFGHPSSCVWFLALSLAMGLMLLLSPVIGTALVFGLTNAMIAAQILAIIVSLIRENERFPSRWGLIFAYSVVAASTILRVAQGLLIDRGMDNLLPADVFLDIHLVAAAIHIGASGAFSLSIAYERSAARLREAALRDPLTGLYNRWSIESLPEIGALSGKRGSTALVLIDIDHFKKVNDHHGHPAGDAAIKRCAGLIRRVFGRDNLMARIGGEEFIILLRGKNAAHADMLAERFRLMVEADRLLFAGTMIKFTVSIGISHDAAGTLSFPDLLAMADQCLYRAKTAGRNRVAVDDPGAVPDRLLSGSRPVPTAPTRVSVETMLT